MAFGRKRLRHFGTAGTRHFGVDAALAPGSAGLHLAAGVPLLRPAEQTFEAMLDGWRNQQLARRLAFSTVEGLLRHPPD